MFVFKHINITNEGYYLSKYQSINIFGRYTTSLYTNSKTKFFRYSMYDGYHLGTYNYKYTGSVSW